VEYTKELQKLFLEMFLADAQSFVRAQNIFRYAHYDAQLREPAKFIYEYANEYKTLPDVEMVNAKTGADLQSAADIDPKHFDWFLDEYERFARHKELESAILASADMLEKGEYGSVEEKIKKAVQVGLTKDMGLDYFEDPKARLQALKDNNGMVPTGWKNFDKKLFGGFNRGELNIFAGGSGAGKSLFLQNLACNYAEQGLNCVYVTLELSEKLTAMRIDAMMTETPTREIYKDLDTVDLKVKMKAKTSGKLRIKYIPAGATALDVRAYIKEFEIQHNLKCDVILIDYLDLLMPMNKRVSPSDLFVKDKYVSEELRNVAVDMNCLLITASQLNRASVEEIEFDHSHISGGLSKIQTADNVIGIFTSRAMRERGKYQIQFMKTRSSSGVGHKVDLEFNVDTLRILDLAEDEEYQSFKKQAPSIYNNLKRTSTVTAEAKAEHQSDEPPKDDIGKVRANVESSKIKDLIKNLGKN
jgi:archaellum biogenesis ATPase FlaH